MTKRPDLNERLLHLIGEQQDGVTITYLEKALNDTVTRRTLQRRLRQLIANGTVISTGKARARSYHLSKQHHPSQVASPEPEDFASLIPLSKTSEKILAQIQQPIQKRTPIGYKRRFLETYKPNTTKYLSENIQSHLLQIGRPPIGDRPAGTYARDILSRFLIDLSWASSHLEGNTYTRLDTQNLIEFGRTAEGKDRTETQMILNHKQFTEY